MSKAYTIGYVGLLEDAPLLVAYANGWFQKENLDVELSRELGWAALNAKLTKGTLIAGNIPALSPLMVARRADRLGQSALQVLVMTSFGGLRLVTSSAIASALTLKKNLPTPLRIGAGAPLGDSMLIASAWQQARGLQAQEMTILPIAVSQFVDALREGYVHGFIAAEPIVSEAVMGQLGITVMKSHEYFPNHPRSVLAVREGLAQNEPEVCERIKKVLQRACAYCSFPANWPSIRALLPVPKFSEHAFDVKQMELPDDMFFDTSVAKLSDRGGTEFLIRACLAMDPTWRETEIRTAVTRAYKRFLAPVAI